MHRLLILAAAASGVVVAVASTAAQLISPTPAAAASATPSATSPPSGDPAEAARVAGANQVPPSGRPILLEAGKGTLIRLPRPASTVFIANPDVADVQIKSPSLIAGSSTNGSRLVRSRLASRGRAAGKA